MSRHHPDETLLTEFAAGQLSPAVALCIRVHLGFCSRCQQQIDRLTCMGAALFEALPGEPVADSVFDQIMARIDNEDVASPVPAPPYGRPFQPVLGPLLNGVNLQDLPWKPQWFKVFEHVLQLGAQGRYRLSLIKINAGGRAPAHGHHGREVTVVLQGGFSDARGHYEAGDFMIMDGFNEHAPRAFEDGDCVCLSLLEAPLRLAGPLGKGIDLLQRFFNPALYKA